ncbi:MAG: BACON domain-containing protein [Flavisolibacter sp.]
MKRFYHWKPAAMPVFFILLAISFTSCKKDKKTLPTPPAFHLRVNPSDLIAGNAGSEKTFTIEANSAWSLSMPAGVDWLQADKTTGNGDATVKLNIVKDNSTGQKRSVVITVSLDNGKADSKQLRIEQEALAVQPVTIAWKKMLGGSGNDLALGVMPAQGGGHLVFGRTTSSNNGDVSPNHGAVDMWLVKLNDNGSIAWEKTYGGTGDEVAAAAAQTADGGFVVTGYTASNSTGDVGANHGGLDFWVIKISEAGTLQWQKTLGGIGDDWPHAIAVTTEGRIAVTGYTKSNNTGDVGANHGGEDLWMAVLESNGSLAWQKVLGGNGSEIGRALVAAPDGGLIVGGTSTSNNNGDVPPGKGSIDFWVMRLDKNGQVNWNKTLGGNNIEELTSLAAGPGNTILATGSTRSNNGDVTGAKGSDDVWLVQLDITSGQLKWQKTFGGAGADGARSITTTPNGKILLAGYSYSHNSGDVGNNTGAGDFWVLALQSTGEPVWKKLLGGDDEEQAFGIALSGQNGYVVTGYTHSNNTGEVGANHGNSDVWVVKLTE